MQGRQVGLERVLLTLFVASGFAGLVYQAIWSHYLGLSLGHAAYAQTLVLAIFMGGMAVGAWLVSRRGVRWKRLIFAYAVVEIVIGLAGLFFHPAFEAYTGFSQGTVYPSLDSELAVRAWQWGSAALLIAPQSILLGMTFPLMSGGYLRVAPGADGEILGGLYFTNSIGAAFGALFATFLLLPWVGMPGAIKVAGVVNLAVGVLAWLASRCADAIPEDKVTVAAPASAPDRPVDPGFYQMMLVAACITGATSFVYEIGWVRMLNQALGTTVHSFEIMLAAFILGLAFGGLWIRRRSQSVGDAVAYAGYAQVWMGIAALVSLPVFNQSFRWVGAIMAAVPRDDTGYHLFSLGSAGIALLVMFPAAFFAGMTLPLFTMALLRKGAGEASIGRIYAANTLGAILGVFLAVHLLIPLLGLHLAVTAAALADIVLGFVLLRRYAETARPPLFLGALATTLVVLGLSLVLGRPDPRTVAAGVFRTGNVTLAENNQVHFLRDGKTATVAVYAQGSVGVIATNGKADASLQMSPVGGVTDDEITMLMAGALPLGLHPDPKRIAVIGWGSGLTTHTLLGSPVPEQVDSVEIERAMYDGAMLVGSRVSRAYQDPRGKLHIDDARTYFSTGHRRYDVIVSEPSNPWVSGVASLFTRQFYRFLASHLEDDGILVQWIQAYEFNDGLLMTMMSALISEFPHTDLYITNQGDLLLVASHRPLPAFRQPAANGSPLAEELARVGLASESDYAVRRIGSRDLLENLVRLSGAEVHDDFYPTVSLQAPRSRFKGEAAFQLQTLLGTGLPVLEMTDGRRPLPISRAPTPAEPSPAVGYHEMARYVREAMLEGESEGLAAEERKPVAEHLARLRSLSAAPVADADLADWLAGAWVLAETTIAHLPPGDLEPLWMAPAWYSAEAQPEVVEAVMAAYVAAARRDAVAMHAAGERALGLTEGSLVAVREHMLVIAMLGALGNGDPDAAVALDRGPGRGIPAKGDYGFIRSYLLAWADRPAR